MLIGEAELLLHPITSYGEAIVQIQGGRDKGRGRRRGGAREGGKDEGGGQTEGWTGGQMIGRQ